VQILVGVAGTRVPRAGEETGSQRGEPGPKCSKQRERQAGVHSGATWVCGNALCAVRGGVAAGGSLPPVRVSCGLLWCEAGGHAAARPGRGEVLHTGTRARTDTASGLQGGKPLAYGRTCVREFGKLDP